MQLHVARIFSISQFILEIYSQSLDEGYKLHGNKNNKNELEKPANTATSELCLSLITSETYPSIHYMTSTRLFKFGGDKGEQMKIRPENVAFYYEFQVKRRSRCWLYKKESG